MPHRVLVVDDAMFMRAMIRDILAGREHGPVRNAVCLNAAAALIVAEKTGDWRDALALAEAAIDDGHAAAKLDALIAFSTSRE